MNPQFRFGFFSRRTLRSMSRAIGPVELEVDHLESRVIDDIERQLRCFPSTHRLGFILGLWFIEWCAPLGGWGLVPFSLLKREQATARLYKLLHSRLTPVRLLLNGARVLICLSAYGHPQVETQLGFERLRWRAQRRATRQALLQRDGLHDATHQYATETMGLPPTPETLYRPSDHHAMPLLSWEVHQELSQYNDLNRPVSPFKIEDLVDPLDQQIQEDDEGRVVERAVERAVELAVELTETQGVDHE